MFNRFPQSDLEVVAPDGSIRAKSKGLFSKDQVSIDDPMIQIFTGDEIRRTLPNGTDEAFEVVDPVFYERFHTIPAHYQVRVRRKGTFPRHSGGHFNISISGSNARVNIGSTDNSSNIANDPGLFAALLNAVQEGISDPQQKEVLTSAVREMERETGQPGFLAAYQKFVGLAADHLGIIGPFLPALTGLLG